MILAPDSVLAGAADFFVTSVVREFPIKKGAVIYKDFYINAGKNNGLKQGAFVDAIRRMPIFDNINSKLLGDSHIKIARLKVIQLEDGFAIARLVKYYDKETTPVTGYDSVMIGDLIEVSEKQ